MTISPIPGAEIIEGAIVRCEFPKGAGVVADMDHLIAGNRDTQIYVVMVLYDNA
jgi:phosphoribosylformylglycinamidine (FGAM) synthase-like enzyme